MTKLCDVYAPDDPPLPQLERVRDAIDAILRTAFASVADERWLAYLNGQRVAFLGVVTRAFATGGPDDPVDGVVYVAWTMAVRVAGFKDPRPWAMARELHNFLFAAGVRRAVRFPPPWCHLPDDLKRAISKRAVALECERDVNVALFVAQFEMGAAMGANHRFQYHAYRFLTQRAAAHSGAKPLSARMPSGDFNEWWPMLRVYMDFRLLGIVRRTVADRPCVRATCDASRCATCDALHATATRELFVRFHDMFCTAPTRAARNSLVADLDRDYVRRRCEVFLFQL